MNVYINSIKFNRSLVDGPGVRTVVFFQGCNLRCKGCQNPSTWEMKKGTKMTTEELAVILKQESVNKKVTFSGGEPLLQIDALLDVIKKLQGFDVAVYTGHEFEEVPQELLENINNKELNEKEQIDAPEVVTNNLIPANIKDQNYMFSIF